MGFSGLLTKFIIGFGVFLILMYFMYIGYFPTDLSLGDGLLFFLITIKFLFVYFVFISSHYALGSLLLGVFLFFKKIFRFILLLRKNFSQKIMDLFFKKIELKDSLNKLGRFFFEILLSVIGVLFLIAFYKNQILNLLIMILLSFIVKFSIDKFLKEYRDNIGSASPDEIEAKNRRLLIMLLYIAIIPSIVYLIYADKNKNFFISQTLESVREDEKNSLIFIKKGFKDFFPESKHGEEKGGYIEIKGSEILLKGVGKNALMQYITKIKDRNGNEVKIKVKVEVPNEALLIVRRSQHTD
ncbi:hypothetical protein ACVIAJ_14125 [Acinetobacter johnsonii]|uniref:Uncharacterized protein n=1 Tax=Acinetobacter johnsonii TaxID=40214 RepID=A0A1R7QD46_ACIJO|nr:hypothetical protein [Acinetobacter johnsonii]SJX22193.1 hypothetical protein ACNJC6_01825 [Acinetobacter johnsonii]